MKRVLSIFIALVMLVSCITVPLCAYSSDDALYNASIAELQTKMKNREAHIEVTIDMPEEMFNSIGADNVYNAVFNDACKLNAESDPALGDYLYNSVLSKEYPDTISSSVSEGRASFVFYADFTYLTTVEEERAVAQFAAKFKNDYLSDDAPSETSTVQSEYFKVKTIYDFIVRNDDYDDEVFSKPSQYPAASPRSKRSHSAYGAIYGTYLDNGKSVAEYLNDMPYTTTITGEKIPTFYDRGLSVCEGFSKLFYYLCVDNGIKAHIVDGENLGERASTFGEDPHEWCYVYLDDGLGDGYQWYNVDSTWAEQNSHKELDINSYNYFLRGSSSGYFAANHHQIAYPDYGTVDRPQLYDWYSDIVVSTEDYRFGKAPINAENVTSMGYSISRTTDYGDGDKVAYIYCEGGRIFTKEIDDITNEVTEETVEGFEYTGYDGSFSVSIPYMLPDEYTVVPCTGKNVGDYSVTVEGASGTSYSIDFKIIPLDMSNKEGNYNEKQTFVQDICYYNGKDAVPEVNIVDTRKNVLVAGKDYEIRYYTDASLSEGSRIDKMHYIGKYYVDIHFIGNYCGNYIHTFTIDKTRLSGLKYFDGEYISFNYLPKAIRYNSQGVEYKTAADYYNDAYKSFSLKDTDVVFKNGVDFTVTSTGSIGYKGEGYLTLTGNASSAIVAAGYPKKVAYKVDRRYNINSQFNGKVAETGTAEIDGKKTVYYYTGSAVKPTSFDWLDSCLARGVDYKIVSYSNNVSAGEAYVNIEGINGCTGKASLVFYINKVNMNSVSAKTTVSGNTVSYKLSYNGMTLKKGTDYTESTKNTATGYSIVLTGKGNYSGTKTINVQTSSGSQSAAPGTIRIVMKKTTLTKLTAGKKKLTVKWKKAGGTVTGYQVQYSTDKKFKKNVKSVKVKGKSKTKTTLKKLKKKKYYVRVRAYYKGTKKTYYADWSNVKNKKAK